MTPGGASGMLLGVDAVREFNVQRDSYGAEYGKHPGGQVIMVTQSGSNEWHGALYEFVRNNALDAANFFDVGSAPPFQRNQFGAASGGALRKDKTFLFGNYEGFRQDLNQTSVAFVPGLAARAAAAPSVQPLLNLWITPPAGTPELNVQVSGLAFPRSSAVRCRRFGKSSEPGVWIRRFHLRIRWRRSIPSMTEAMSRPLPPILTAQTF